jgi:hypothetical protein
MAKKYDRWRRPNRYNDAPEWLEPQLWTKRSPLDRWDRTIMDGIALIEAFLPVGGVCYNVVYLSCQALHLEHFCQL